jgi:membrane-associated phospholipid phosphatase
VQAVVDVESRSRTSSRWSARLVGEVLPAGLLVVLTALLVGVVAGGSVNDWDLDVYRWAPAAHWPELGGILQWWVMLGQRAICLAIAAAWLGLRAWRERDLRPLGVLLVATLLTNIGVGTMKTLVGRLGPLQLGADAGLPGATDVFAPGGTIFPSGHTANAVVTWGVLVLVARGHRRLGAVLAAVVAVTVGLTTVYLGTHWLSDVVAGWCAGGLVLLALPTVVPRVERAAARAWSEVAARRARRYRGRTPGAWVSTVGSR